MDAIQWPILTFKKLRKIKEKKYKKKYGSAGDRTHGRGRIPICCPTLYHCATGLTHQKLVKMQVMKLLYWSNSDGSGSKKAQKTHLVPKNMVRILKSNVQYHKVFSKIFLQFFFIPRRKNAWISIFFTKFSGNIEIFSASPRILSILPSNLVKKILIQAFFLIGNKKNCRKIFSNTQ